MRSFFGRSQPADNVEASANGAQRTGTFTSAFASFFGRGRNQASEQDVNINESSHKADVEGIMLRSAAQTLSESIEIILSENDSLSGDHLNGFISLMRILDCEDLEIHALDRSSFDDEGFTPSKTDSHTSHSGEGCIQILLNNMEHPEFVETCTNHHVAVSLVQALRLLKIFEIKVAKKAEDIAAVSERQSGKSDSSVSTNNLSGDLAEEFLRGDADAAITTRTERSAARKTRDADIYSQPGASRKSSGRACRLLCALSAEPETWDLLHKNKALEKLLMFPLSALPEKALHLQVDVAGVISAMCAMAMPSEHVWLVHDQNIIPLMTRSLKELCASIETTKLVTKLNGDLRVAAATATSPAGGSGGGTSSEALTPVMARRGSVRSRNSKFSKTSQHSGAKDGVKETAEDQDEDHPGAGAEVEASDLARDIAKISSGAHAANDSTGAYASQDSSNSLSIGLSTASSKDKDSYSVSGNAGNNKILRGEIAERAGMWITGANVLIDVICASMSVNAVLMNDFEYAGGYKLMVYILQHSSQNNCTQTLMAITRLLTDPFHATEDALSFPTVGAVILEVLVGVLHLTEPIDKEDAADMSKFIRIAQGIVSALREGMIAPGWEVLIQNVAYVLLTLYSNHPRNCIMLEESYQFLSILLLCIPSMSSQDTIAAVLTTLHFVCHSIPDATTLPLVAATAALGVCVNLGINIADVSMSSLQSLPSSPSETDLANTRSARVASSNMEEIGVHDVAGNAAKAQPFLPAGAASNVLATLDALLQSFDSIAAIKSKYALQILRGGLLHSVVCPVFENLGFYLTQENSKEAKSGEQISLPTIAQDKALIYVLLVELLLDLTEKSPQGAEEIRHSGLNVILRNLIRAEQSSIELMRHFLRLPEGLAACETTHLEEAMQTIFDVLHQLNALKTSPGADELNVVYQNSTCEKIKALLFSLYSILEKTDDAVWVWKKFKGFHAITETIAGLKPYFASVATGKGPFAKTPTVILASSALEAALECASLELSLVELDQHERSRDARHKALVIADSILSSGIVTSSCAADCIPLITSLMCGFSAVIEAEAKEGKDANIACPEMSLVFLRILPQLSDELALKALQSVELHARSRFDGYQQLAECGFVSYALEHHGDIMCAGCNAAPESSGNRRGVASALLRMIQAIMNEYLTLTDFAAYLKYFVRPTLVHNASRDPADGGNYKLLLPYESYQNDDVRSSGATKAVLDHLFSLSSRYAKATLSHSPAFISLGCGASNEKYEAAYLDMRAPDLNRLMPAGNTTFMCWLRCADPRPGKTKSSLATNFHAHTMETPKAVGTPGKKVSVGAFAGSQVSLPPPTVGAQSDRTFASLGVLSVQDTGTFIPVVTFTAHPRGCFFEVLMHVRSSRVIVYCKAPNNFRALIFKPKRKLLEGDWAHLAVSVKKTRRFMGTSKSFVSVFINGEECENMSSDVENASCVDFDIPLATKDGPLACQITMGRSLLAMSAAESSHGMFIAEHGDLLPNISSGYVNRWQLGPTLVYDTALPHAQLAYIYLSGPDYSGMQGSTGSHDLPISETLTSLSTTILERCKNANGTVSSFVSGLSFEGVEFVVEPLMEKCSFSVLSVPIPQIPTAVLDYNARNSVCLHVTPSFIADAISRHKNVSENPPEGSVHLKKADLESSPFSALRVPRTTADASASAASALEAKLPPRPTTPSKISRGYFSHVERAKRVSQAKLNTIQATKLTLLNSVSMDNSQPLAICAHGWHSSFSESYSSCIGALGGPSVLFPLLQVASTEDVLCKVLMLLRCSVLHSPANLKLMQNGGYEEVAFIMACKPRSLLTPQVLNLLFMFSTNEDIFGSAKLSPKTRGQATDGKDALPSQRTTSYTGLNSGLLLVDTVSLHSFTMNHWVWNVTSFDLVMGVLANLTDLVDDYVYGTLNSHRLSALGAARWVLLMAAYGADRADRTAVSSVFSMAVDTSIAQLQEKIDASASSAARERESAAGAGAATPIHTKWKMATFDSAEVSNGCEAAEPFLAKAMEVVKAVMRVELRKRDIELIGNIILYTFIPARPTYVDDNDAGGQEHLSTFTLLRVYLMRLVFTLYDVGIDDPTPSDDPARRSLSPSPLVKEIALSFRSVFTPDWFLAILEKVSDLPTFTDCLRLLALFIQKDPIFRKDFTAANGIRVLRGILTCRPQELSVILPLLALFLQIPMHILPFANQARSVEKITHLLDLEECIGPDLHDPDHSGLYIPLFKLLLECVNINVHSLHDGNFDKDAAAKCRYVGEIILRTLNYAFAHTLTFKEFIQERTVIAALTAAALSSSTGMDDFGSYATTVSVDLDSSLQEEYCSNRSRSPSAISGATTFPVALTEEGSAEGSAPIVDRSTRFRRASKVRYIDDDDDNIHDKGVKQAVCLKDFEGEELKTMIYRCITSALVDVNHCAILSSLLLSLPPHVVGSYQTGCQIMLLEIASSAVRDILDKDGTDIAVFHGIANALTLLIPLTNTFVLHDTNVLLQVFKLAVYALNKMINYFPTMPTGGMGVRMSAQSGKGSGSAFQLLDPLVKSFGTTARFLAARCVNGLVNNVDISREDRDAAVRSEVFGTIRENMAILLANAFEDTVEPLLEILPVKKGLFGFSAAPAAAPTAADDRAIDGSQAKGGFGGFFGISSSAEKTPTLPTGLSKHSVHNRETAAAALAAAVIHKTKMSQIFCAKIVASCHSFFLDDNNDCRIESARIFALLIIHKRALIEHLFFSEMPFKTGVAVSASAPAEVPNNSFFRRGVEILAPSDGMLSKYETFLRGLTTDSDGEDHRMPAFTHWLTENVERSSKLFESVERALKLYSDANATDQIELQKQIIALKLPARGYAVDLDSYDDVIGAAGIDASMKRAEEVLRKGEFVVGSVRQWRVAGYSQGARGGLHWRRNWLLLQAGPVWGYLPVLAGQIDAVTKVWRVSSAEGPERTRRRLEQEFSTSALGVLYFPPDDGKSRKMQLTTVASRRSRSMVTSAPRANPLTAGGIHNKANLQLLEDVIPDSVITTSSDGSGAIPDLDIPTIDDVSENFDESSSEGSEEDSEAHSQDMLAFMQRMSVNGLIKKVRGHAAAMSSLHDFVIDENEGEELAGSNPGSFTHGTSTGSAPSKASSTSDAFPSSGARSASPSLSGGAANGAWKKPEGSPSMQGAGEERRDKNRPSFGSRDRLDSEALSDSGSDLQSLRNTQLLSSVWADENGDGRPRVDSAFIRNSEGADSRPRVDSSFLRKNSDDSEGQGVSRDSRSSSLPTKDSSLTVSSSSKTADDASRQHNSDKTFTRDLSRKEWVNNTRIEANRTLALQELVKGIIGATVFSAKGTVFYNVQKIVGLELQRAIVVFTPKTLHILSGFRAVNGNKAHARKGPVSSDVGEGSVKGSDCVLEWVGLTPGAEEGSLLAVEETIQHNKDKLSGIDSADKHKVKTVNSEEAWLAAIWGVLLKDASSTYASILLDDVYSIFKRRHHLKYTALEITDTFGSSFLFSCSSPDAMNALLVNMLEQDLPASIFRQSLGAKNMQMLRGATHMYNRLMASFVSSIAQMWERGQISNFEYLMHLNAAAGRSFSDLTQYPIFPWILADYTSEKLDLNDDNTFRDLSKPMGALSEKRANQFRERYSTLDEIASASGDYGSDEGSSSVENSNAAPPFFYGTHYSCAGYVLHYLNRLQPYADMSIALQGGRFDNPDRLFIDVASSWRSASQENLQDVRELIPEFFYCPEFLVNSNQFNFGATQRDVQVNDVVLPRWANGDPHEFVRKHREALESKYVSENLHNWIDLIFGYKQRGEEAVKSMNVFIHLTYEGEVDVDAITDPLLRSATISQINNFGQCPSVLFSKPHRPRVIPEIFKKTAVTPRSAGYSQKSVSPSDSDASNINLRMSYDDGSFDASQNDVESINVGLSAKSPAEIITSDATALAWHEHISPPLCVVGASNIIDLVKVGKTEHFTRSEASSDKIGIADVQLYKGNINVANKGSVLLPQGIFGKKIIRYGGPGCGFIVLANLTVAGGLTNAATGMGTGGIGSMVAGMTLTTGTNQGTRFNSVVADQDKEVFSVHARLHGGPVTCMLASKDGAYLFSGSKDCSVRLWSTQSLLATRRIDHIHTFVGHTASIVCMDYCEEFHTLVSGCEAGTVCVWDTRTSCLIRILTPLVGTVSEPILSVSMSAASGVIATLSRSVLCLYTINGVLLASHTLVHGRSSGKGKDVDADGQVVLALSTADWQDGISCVTGHASGSVLFWKLRTEITRGDAEPGKAAQIVRGLVSTTSSGISSRGTNVGVARTLYVAYTLPRTHSTSITTLSVVSSVFASAMQSVMGGKKEVVNRAHSNAGTLELLVGDSAGFVSRWGSAKLDSLINSEKVTLVLDK